jgi:DNA-binding response OmpR family regulator
MSAASAQCTPAEILIIDDDLVMRELLELHLTDEGYRVRVAEDAVEGGRMLVAALPDLLLLDMRMPHMKGDEFLELLRGDENFTNLKVIVLTAERGVDFMIKVTDLGVSDYLNKPIDKDELLATVRRVLAE